MLHRRSLKRHRQRRCHRSKQNRAEHVTLSKGRKQSLFSRSDRFATQNVAGGGMVSTSGGRRESRARLRSARGGVPAVRMQNLTGHVARVLAGEKQERWRNLVRLTG